MDKFVVEGPCVINGNVEISAAKNSVLKLLAASILIPGKVTIQNVPNLNDIKTMLKLLKEMGANITQNKNEVEIDCSDLNQTKAHYEIVRTMRASILVLGPLLARFGQGSVSLPGGCAIGARPIDLHLMGFKLLGAEIEIFDGYVVAKAAKLKGTIIDLPFPSVGATENILMCSVFAEGETIIRGAAREPEIEDLGLFLMKAYPKLKIQGLGTNTIKISGIKKNENFKNISHQPIGDRIEALTMIMAAALCTSQSVIVSGFNPQHCLEALNLLQEMNVKMTIKENSVEIFPSKKLKPINVETKPFPGFPTDAQAQLVALCLQAEGQSQITETIFENRFMHVPELIRMNADLQIQGNKVIIRGGKKLVAAPVMCTDLRASAALVLASLCAEGSTSILRVYHLDRGYDALEKKLAMLGAKISRVKE